EHVVAPVVGAGAFNGDDVLGFFDDAQQSGVAVFVAANGTDFVFGDVEADFAQPDLGFDLGDRIGQGDHVFFGGFQDVEGDALGRFGADAGQPAQLIDEGLYRTVVHVGAYFRSGMWRF